MKIRDKASGQFQGVGSHRTCQLDHHKYQHQETSHFAKSIGKEIHHRHKSHRSQTGHRQGFPHFHRLKTVTQMKHKDHHRCLEQGNQIQYRCLASPPGQTGFQLSAVLCQRIHKTKGNTAYPKCHRHHIGGHGMAVIFYPGDLCFFCFHRSCKHIRRIFSFIRIPDLFCPLCQTVF